MCIVFINLNRKCDEKQMKNGSEATNNIVISFGERLYGQ